MYIAKDAYSDTFSLFFRVVLIKCHEQNETPLVCFIIFIQHLRATKS